MADLGESISDSIKKSRDQNPKQELPVEDEKARQYAWSERIKKILGYGKSVDKQTE